MEKNDILRQQLILFMLFHVELVKLIKAIARDTDASTELASCVKESIESVTDASAQILSTLCVKFGISMDELDEMENEVNEDAKFHKIVDNI